jgi:hypothetical protein
MYIVMTTEHCFPGTLLHLTNLYSFFTGALRQKLVIPEQLKKFDLCVLQLFSIRVSASLKWLLPVTACDHTFM